LQAVDDIAIFSIPRIDAKELESLLYKCQEEEANRWTNYNIWRKERRRYDRGWGLVNQK